MKTKQYLRFAAALILLMFSVPLAYAQAGLHNGDGVYTTFSGEDPIGVNSNGNGTTHIIHINEDGTTIEEDIPDNEVQTFLWNALGSDFMRDAFVSSTPVEIDRPEGIFPEFVVPLTAPEPVGYSLWVVGTRDYFSGYIGDDYFGDFTDFSAAEDNWDAFVWALDDYFNNNGDISVYSANNLDDLFTTPEDAFDADLSWSSWVNPDDTTPPTWESHAPGGDEES